MPLSNGLPIPPAPGDWLELPAWARERDPYRGVPLLTTSKASSRAVRDSSSMGSLVTGGLGKQSATKQNHSCGCDPRLLQLRGCSVRDDLQCAWKRRASKSEENQEKRCRNEPPVPMAAPSARPGIEIDPHTLCGRTSLSLPAVERFIRYSEGFVNEEFLAMKRHLSVLRPSDCSGIRLSPSNLHLLAAFLAAAKFDVSDVAGSFQVLQQQEHHIWILPLKNMWKPAFGCPQFLARSGWHSYWFAHGSDDVGLLGVLQYRKMRRSFPDGQYPTTGFFCAATHDIMERSWPILRCWSSSKNQAGVVIVGMAAIEKQHRKVESGGTYAEQQACSHGHVVHNPRQKRWCINPEVAQVMGLAIVQTMPP